MNTINGIPIIWDREADNKLFGKLSITVANLGNEPSNTIIKKESSFESQIDKNINTDNVNLQLNTDVNRTQEATEVSVETIQKAIQ